MSWLSSGLKKVGGVAEKAAPFVGLIPGVGTIAGGAIGGLGALAHGDGLSGALKYGAMGAASGYGGGLLRGAMSGRNGGSGSPTIGGNGPLSDLPGVDIGRAPTGILGGLKRVGGEALGALGGQGGLASSVLGGIKNNLDPIMGGAAIAAGYKRSQAADDYRNQALKLQMGDWNDRAGLRKVGIQGMQNETAPSLSSAFASPNPFRRAV